MVNIYNRFQTNGSGQNKLQLNYSNKLLTLLHDIRQIWAANEKFHVSTSHFMIKISADILKSVQFCLTCTPILCNTILYNSILNTGMHLPLHFQHENEREWIYDVWAWLKFQFFLIKDISICRILKNYNQWKTIFTLCIIHWNVLHIHTWNCWIKLGKYIIENKLIVSVWSLPF